MGGWFLAELQCDCGGAMRRCPRVFSPCWHDAAGVRVFHWSAGSAQSLTHLEQGGDEAFDFFVGVVERQ